MYIYIYIYNECYVQKPGQHGAYAYIYKNTYNFTHMHTLCLRLQVRMDTLTPTWNEMFVLESEDNMAKFPLIVSIFDFDSTIDELIGHVTVDVSRIPTNTWVQRQWAVSNDDHETGRLTMRILYEPAQLRMKKRGYVCVYVCVCTNTRMYACMYVCMAG
jgi:hypothetical protein